MDHETGREPKAHRRTFLRRVAVALAAALGVSATRRVAGAGADPVETPAIPGTPGARGPEPFIGEIIAVPYTFAPRGFVFCEGQTLPINNNAALFSLLGVNYGGDGRNTFQLPDTRDVEAAAKKAGRSARPPFRYAIAVTGVFPSRS